MMLDDLLTQRVGVTRKSHCRCCTPREMSLPAYPLRSTRSQGTTAYASRITDPRLVPRHRPDLPKKPRGPKANGVQTHIDDKTREGPETPARPRQRPNEHTSRRSTQERTMRADNSLGAWDQQLTPTHYASGI